MPGITRYCYLSGAKDVAPDRIQFNLSALDPFDALKVVLEQRMYLNFITLGGISTTVDDFQREVSAMCYALPDYITTSNASLNSLYAIGIQFLRKTLNISRDFQKYIQYSDLLAIFNQPTGIKYNNYEYTCTMVESFLLEWWNIFCDNTVEVSTDVPIFVPSREVYLQYNPAVYEKDNNDYGIRIRITPVCTTFFKWESRPQSIDIYTSPVGALLYLDAFNLHRYDFTDVVGILASFCLDHSKYVMAKSRACEEAHICDICFDLVTGSDYTCRAKRSIGAVQVFLGIIKYNIKYKRLQPLSDYSLFGELLRICDVDPKLINYFTKPISAISASEASAFRNSEYADMIPDRFTTRPGMAAIDDETNDDDMNDANTDDATQDASDTNSDTPDMGEDATSDDALSGDISDAGEDTKDAKSEVNKPKPLIDPNQMLLELAKSDENLSDYLYKEMVARRINAILRNPPENAMPNDLLMLKRWRSRWLFLVSVSCIRDFLTRISLRLSNN